MPVFIVTHSRISEFVVAVEAESEQDAEKAVAEANCGVYYGVEWKSWEDTAAEPSDGSEGPSFRVVDGKLERVAIPVPQG